MGRWTEFLQGSPSGGHAVHVYQDVSELVGSVGAYVTAGFEAGEPAVVIATSEHWELFAADLVRRGWNAADAEQRRLLARADADATLATFMDGGLPSAHRFEQVVGALLDRVAEGHPGRRIRAFGEMVDVLCAEGEPKAALALEELWNDLARTRDFSLLCGYQLDLFDRSAQVSPLPGVCRAHTHVRPAGDPARLTRAVDLALEEVLGPGQAGKVYVLVAEQARDERVPAAQLALMWVSANMPVLADRVLAAARAHYGERHAVSPVI
jgi:hypothetical protein